MGLLFEHGANALIHSASGQQGNPVTVPASVCNVAAESVEQAHPGDSCV